MPKLKGRGKLLRTRTVRLPGEHGYRHLEVYSKAGSHGGHTVLGKLHAYKHGSTMFR